MDTLLSGVILECSLGNEPDPPPNFSFTVQRILASRRTEILQEQRSTDSILLLNKTVLVSLFSADTESITVTCIVSNIFGIAGIFTSITVCGMYMGNQTFICFACKTKGACMVNVGTFYKRHASLTMYTILEQDCDLCCDLKKLLAL